MATTVRRALRWTALWALATTCVAGTAMAGQASGVALLEAVNVPARTVTLLGESYRVTDATRMVDPAGRGIELERLRPIPEGATLVAEDDADAVAWQAVASPSGWVLTNLKVLKAMPD